MDPYIGEIRAVAFPFAPRGWAVCDGSLLAIDANDVLFSLLGTTYGGDGQYTFGLPDFRGRVAVGAGQQPKRPKFSMGQMGGTEGVSLSPGEMPIHNHDFSLATATADTTDPSAGTFTELPTGGRGDNLYSLSSDSQAAQGVIGATGGGAAHENRQPYICMLYIIALEGLFPSP